MAARLTFYINGQVGDSKKHMNYAIPALCSIKQTDITGRLVSEEMLHIISPSYLCCRFGGVPTCVLFGTPIKPQLSFMDRLWQLYFTDVNDL